jgi:outer membrane protein OmpA-like peptidoglycan-associated protein
MSSESKGHWGGVLAMLAAMIVVLCAFGTPTAAQDWSAPKWEIFGGYSFLYPNATVHGVLPLGVLPLSSNLESNPRGFGGSVTYNFNRWVGITLDGSEHWHSGEVGVPMRIDDAAFWNVSVGPKITFRGLHAPTYQDRMSHFSPFLEFLVGVQDLSPDAFYSINKFGFMAGGGLDVNLSKHFALRLIRADFVYSNYRYGPPAVTLATNLRGVRVQTGIVILLGGGAPPPLPVQPPVASCSAGPQMVYAGSGDSVAVRADASDPGNHALTYSWTTTGGTVEGSGPQARWNSSGTAPGTYTVGARVDNGHGGTADCTAEIRVQPRPHRPPTMSCSADHGTVTVGQPVEITAIASDPDNDPLTFTWNATGGKVESSGSSVEFQTADLAPGTYVITGHVDNGYTGTADCTVNVDVQAPAPPPEVAELEERLALHSIYFPTARPTEANPTGGLVESQQTVLASLADDFNRYLTYKPDAHLILEGHADQRGSIDYNNALTERRVERAKSFLVEHGVPAANIETRSLGKQENLDAEQVKQLIDQNPDLSDDDRQRLESNLPVIILANNRRVDVSLNTTGQQSVRQYPFNAKDALTLLSTEGGKDLKHAKPPAEKKSTEP